MEIKVSVVVTVKNDEPGIFRLKKGLDRQTVKPDEVIIIRAEDYGDCSRGRGRNIGVRAARNELIAVTDAGCRPRREWIDKIYKCYKNYKNHNLLVVAGGYRAAAKTELERVMAYFLVPRKYYEETPRLGGESPLSGLPRQGRAFLPASRSIMFTKQAWQAVGGYPEEAVSGAEDLEFARRLAAHPEIKMIYCPEAVVDWEPPSSLGEFFRDMVKHTRGNVEIMYWPHLWRNLTVAGRWGVFLVFPWMIPLYFGVKIIKIINVIKIKIIKDITVINILRLIMVQAAADGGVMAGLAIGIMSRMGRMGRMS